MGQFLTSTNPANLTNKWFDAGVEKAADYDVLVTDEFLVGDGASATVEFTLPLLSTLEATATYMWTFTAKDITNAVTIAANATDTGKLNGGDSVTIPATYAGFIVRNVAADYYVALPMQVNT